MFILLRTGVHLHLNLPFFCLPLPPQHLQFGFLSSTSVNLDQLPKVKWKWSCSVMSDFLQWHEPARLLHPWDFPGKSAGVGCHFLLQGIFPTQGWNLGLPHCRQTPYHLGHQGSPPKVKHPMKQLNPLADGPHTGFSEASDTDSCFLPTFLPGFYAFLGFCPQSPLLAPLSSRSLNTQVLQGWIQYQLQTSPKAEVPHLRDLMPDDLS